MLEREREKQGEGVDLLRATLPPLRVQNREIVGEEGERRSEEGGERR